MKNYKKGLFSGAPFIYNYISRSIKKILNSGGIVISFSCPIYSEKYIFVTSRNGSIDWYSQEDETMTNISYFPNILNYNKIPIRKEIFINEDINLFSKIFNKYKDNFSASISFKINNETDIPLAFDKFKEIISFIRVYKTEDNDSKKNGFMIILPDIEPKHELIYDLLVDILPSMRPSLFPYISNYSWVNEKIYQPPSVLKLLNEKADIENELNEKINDINKKINDEKQKYSHLYGILQSDAFDENLTNNLSLVLQDFGYKDVLLPDKKYKEENKNLQEDIQIRNNGELILIEAKGLTGLPTESDCNQILKYILRRQKEEERTDVKGIFVVNSERNIPPLDRKKNPFTESQISDAENSGYSLITTWQLYNAFFALHNNELTLDDINDSLFKKGLVHFLPKSWHKIGRITHIYPEAGSMRLEIDNDHVKIGDKLGYVHENKYIVEKIKTLQINKKNVDKGLPGQHIGIIFTKLCNKNTAIYKIY